MWGKEQSVCPHSQPCTLVTILVRLLNLLVFGSTAFCISSDGKHKKVKTDRLVW